MNELTVAKIMVILAKVAQSCSKSKKLLKVKKVAQSRKSCQKVAEHNLSVPIFTEICLWNNPKYLDI